MKLFKINPDDVIRTQNGLWQWNEEEGRFMDAGNIYKKASDLKRVNAIYRHGNTNDQYKIKAGDLIEVEGSNNDAGNLFTIIDVTIVDVMELLDIAHKAGVGLSYCLASIKDEVYYDSYQVCDLTINGLSETEEG